LYALGFTGEEDEDVEMELKGVKLYIKRGEKPFGDGIVGHLKLLAHRTTLEERIREYIILERTVNFHNYGLHNLSFSSRTFMEGLHERSRTADSSVCVRSRRERNQTDS